MLSQKDYIMNRILRLFLLISIFSLLVVPFSFTAAQDAPVTLQLSWWGGDQRAAMYNRMADRYEELNPNVTILREFAGFNAYFERLATQVAGGNAPDIVHMHATQISSYVQRGALLDLTPLTESGAIDLSNFAPGIVDSGRVDGRIYMITLGNSVPGTHYNMRILNDLGIEPPAYSWTWDDFTALALSLVDQLPEGVYAAADGALQHDSTFEPYVRQRGYALFDGQRIGYPKEVLVDWWTIWQTLRQAGALPPIDLTVERLSDGVENNVLVTGEVVMMMLSGNQHRLYQNNTPDLLGLTTIPRAVDPNAPFGDALGGAYIAISASSRNVDAAAAFINWFVNDEEAARMYNGEHGPVGSSVMQAAIADQQTPADQRLADMVAYIAQDVRPIDPRPAQAGEVVAAYNRIYQRLAFGEFPSVEAAVDAFFNEAEFILE
jgi:multiple sugar transport system substrate-binding protein